MGGSEQGMVEKQALERRGESFSYFQNSLRKAERRERKNEDRVKS